jgi:hypothetical protein
VKLHLAFGLILLFTGAWGAAVDQTNTLTIATGSASETKSSAMSDRELHGLRGPVKTYVEETIYPGVTGPDGAQIPERKSSYTTEYDVTGLILATHISNSDGSEWEMRYSYDASGHLLKTASGKEGEPPIEAVYSYDDRGRIVSSEHLRSHREETPTKNGASLTISVIPGATRAAQGFRAKPLLRNALIQKAE